MTCLRLCTNNLLEGVSKVNAITATSASLPALNLTNSRKSLPWRSTAVATEQIIRVDLTSANAINMVAVLFTNLTPNATVKAYLYTNIADVSPVYTSAATPVFANNTSTNGSTAAQNSYAYGKGTAGVVYFPEATVQRVDIGITDTGNTAGYLQVGTAIIGKYWSPVKNFERGETFQIVDNSEHFRTDSADLLSDNGSKFRKIGFKLSNMLEADRNTVVNMLRANGKTVPLFLSLYPANADSAKEEMYMMQCKLDDISQIEHPYFERYGIPLTFLEV